jgi:hypothetical protein
MSTVRRIVTGHDASGKSVFLSVGEPPQFHGRPPGPTVFYELWNTAQAPARITATEDREPNDRLPLRLPPDAGGTIIRILDLHPGHVQALAPRDDGRHPGMHRTRTIDYGIVLEGSLWLMLDDSEVLCEPGDVVIQRGTAHAWENRSNAVARIAFVLIDAEFEASLAGKIGDDLMHATLQQREQQDADK